MFFGRDDPSINIPIRLEPILASGSNFPETSTSQSSHPGKKPIRRRNRPKKVRKKTSQSTSAAVEDGGSDSDGGSGSRLVDDHLSPCLSKMYIGFTH